MNRLTINLKKSYDEKWLGKNKKSPYEINIYLPNKEISKQQCYDKLGIIEDIEEEMGLIY